MFEGSSRSGSSRSFLWCIVIDGRCQSTGKTSTALIARWESFHTVHPDPAKCRNPAKCCSTWCAPSTLTPGVLRAHQEGKGVNQMKFQLPISTQL
eukprot:4396782-Prymnesium_polylepis.3